MLLSCCHFSSYFGVSFCLLCLILTQLLCSNFGSNLICPCIAKVTEQNVTPTVRFEAWKLLVWKINRHFILDMFFLLFISCLLSSFSLCTCMYAFIHKSYKCALSCNKFSAIIVTTFSIEKFWILRLCPYRRNTELYFHSMCFRSTSRQKRSIPRGIY